MMTAKMRYQPFACGTGGTVSTLSTQARRPARTYREEIEERVEVLANQTSRVQVQFATEQDQQGKAQEVLPRVSHGLLYMRQEKVRRARSPHQNKTPRGKRQSAEQTWGM